MEGQTLSLSFEGIEELQETFAELVKKYPDRAGELLRENARKFRKEVVEEVKREKKSRRTSKKSLTKAGSFKISPVQKTGDKQHIEISAKAPHFHLVENGHVLTTKDGRAIGFIQGRHMMENTFKKHKEDAVKETEEMIDKLLKEAGLL